MDSKSVVEAVLFSAERPLRVVDIARGTGYSSQTVRRAIRVLGEEYEERGSALEVDKVDSHYSIKLRDDYLEVVSPFVEKEVPDEALKAAAMIAYRQPILQSDLVRMLGGGVYEHVRILRSMGLIRAVKKGHTLSLSTTRRFSEYFGLESSKKEDIKRWMEERLGT
ncbi:MAG: SMC-Scp complex subunit ScpB [Methanomassiliicoccales archaeon]